MAYQMAATVVTLNDFEDHSPVVGLFKCNPMNICVAFYTVSTDSALARFLCISRASCSACIHTRKITRKGHQRASAIFRGFASRDLPGHTFKM